MRTLRGERGLAPAMLVVVVAWALAAVLMLTGTLLAAQAIEGRVKTIMGATSDIDGDLDAVRLAAGTSRTAARIFEAAAPLSGELDQVIVAARGIDRKARSIRRSAGSIDELVVSINASAESINATVESIRSTAGSIDAKAESIEAKTGAIEATAGSIDGNAQSIETRVAATEASVDGIEGLFTAILVETPSIDRGVAGINIRASTTINRVRPIREDTRDILDQLGQPDRAGGRRQRGGDKSLRGHSDSINRQLGGQLTPDRGDPPVRVAPRESSRRSDRRRGRSGETPSPAGLGAPE